MNCVVKHHRHQDEVLNVRYNPEYDQLVLSAGQSGKVVMDTHSKLSDEPRVSDYIPDGQVGMLPATNGTMKNDVEWSVGDPWTFARLRCELNNAYLVISQVPERYRNERMALPEA